MIKTYWRSSEGIVFKNYEDLEEMTYNYILDKMKGGLKGMMKKDLFGAEISKEDEIINKNMEDLGFIPDIDF